MPKFPVVSGAEVVRALEHLGFVVARQRGSHIVMRRGPTGCVVPNHREVKVGALVGLLKYRLVSPPTNSSMLFTPNTALQEDASPQSGSHPWASTFGPLGCARWGN